MCDFIHRGILLEASSEPVGAFTLRELALAH